VVRQIAARRTTFADSTGQLHPVESARHIAAARAQLLVRVLAAPVVAAAFAVAGAVFVILLPVCGIASIAEAVAREGWRFLRSTGRATAPYRARHS
jgi:hypothetical protein